MFGIAVEFGHCRERLNKTKKVKSNILRPSFMGSETKMKSSKMEDKGLPRPENSTDDCRTAILCWLVFGNQLLSFTC